MSATGPDGDSPAGDGPAPVVPQRLRPPRARSGSLPRERLVQRVLGCDLPVVAMLAGAGYGKTTLLRDWAEAEPRPVGWVTMDRTDDDPVVLVRHLTRALASCGLQVDALEAAAAQPDPRFDRDVLPELAAAIEGCEHPFLLLLDDVHVVTGRESLALLDELLMLVPERCTVGLASRGTSSLRLARRALDGSLFQLGQDDLAFRDDEALAVLASELVGLRPDQERDLVAFAQGWPAGLHLAVLALRDHPDPQGVLRTLVVGDPRVTAYLHQEVLDRLDPAMRDFLVRAAVLDRLSPSACDAVLERRDSAEVIDQLTRSGNLFVQSFDVGDEHRLHDLYRGLLLRDLDRSHPGEQARLRRRAAQWYDEQGRADDAVTQAVATGDRTFASGMLHRQLFPTMVAGRVTSLGRWLGMFPPEQVRGDGLVALSAGWHALSLGRIAELTHHVADARRATVDGPLPDGSSSFAAALAALEMTAAVDGTKAAVEHAHVVLDAGPGGSPWEGLARFTAALGEGLLGRLDLVSSLTRAEVATRGLPAVHALCQAQLGWSLLRGGDVAEGTRWARLAYDELVEHDLEGFALAAPVHGVDCYASAFQRDEQRSMRAAAAAEAALDRLRYLVPRGRLHVRLMLADASVRLGHPGEARRQLEQCTDLLVIECDTVVLVEWSRQLREVLEREGRALGLVELTAAEQRVLEQLPTHRSLVEIGEHLYVSRNTVKTHTLSIYRKLAVSGRSEAVERAIELGLLPPGGVRR